MAYRFMCYPGGVRKAVTFSYDDGCEYDLRLRDIFNSYGMKATFNINSDRLINGNGISVADARSFIAEGHEIAVHGKYHKANGVSSAIDGIRDVLLCREELENALDTIIRGMAYPDTGILSFANGTDYNKVKAYLSDLGIVYSRTVGDDNNRFDLPSDWYQWMPTAHHNNPEIFRFADEFLAFDLEGIHGAMRQPRLFYVWGHSYEFDCEGNWERIEEICRRFSGREDIWFATNMEIYDYVNAYNSLVWSADGKRVYNPTLIDVYFAVGNERYKVSSGETLVIG